MNIPEKYKMRKKYEKKLDMFLWDNPYVIAFENDFISFSILGVSNEDGTGIANEPDSEQFTVTLVKKEWPLAPPHISIDITSVNPEKSYPRMALTGLGIFTVYEIVSGNGFTTEEKDIAYSIIAACDTFHSMYPKYWLK